MLEKDPCQAIVIRYKNGETEAINELPQHIDCMIYSIIKKFANQLPLDELYQTAWISIMNSIEKYQLNHKTKFTTYAYKGILFKCLNEVSIKRAQEVSLNTLIGSKDGTIALEDTIGCKTDVATAVVNDMYLAYIMKDIATIPIKKQREILELFMTGMSQKEIAYKLNITPSYVSKTISNYRKKLDPS